MTKAGLAWQVKSKGWRASDRDVSQRSTLCVRVGDFGGGNALQTRLKSVPVADICRIERRVKMATYVLLVSKKPQSSAHLCPIRGAIHINLQR